MSTAPLGPLVFYSVSFIVCTVLLLTTLSTHPLFPLQLDSKPWLQAWLAMTVGDYYGAALPLCGIAIFSEDGNKGWLWSIGMCLLGSPVCNLYVLQRIYYHRDGLMLRY